jgi:Tfp pilus assembly protein PilF
VRRRGFVSLFVTFLSFLPPSIIPLDAEAGRDVSRIQADAFVVEAQKSFASGSLALAQDLLVSALEISPQYSEALYLRALVELTDRASTRAAILDLRRAVDAGSWSWTEPMVAEQRLAEALLRTGGIAEARPLAQRLANAHPEDLRNFLLLARLEAKAGDAKRSQAVLADARARFPLEDEAALLSIDLLDRFGRRDEARAIAEKMSGVHPGTLPFLLHAARLEPDRRRRLAALDRYIGAGGTDPLAHLIALEGKTKNGRKHLTHFLDNDGLGRQDLVPRVVAATSGNKELTAILETSLSRFAGNRDLDTDGDGFFEERWVFEAGQPSRWILDADQDGVPEFMADFDRGVPAALSWSPRPGVQLAARYGEYPFIASVHETSEGTVRRYSLALFALRCEFLATHPPKGTAGATPRARLRPIVPSPDEIAKAAFLMEEQSGDGARVVRRIRMLHGEPVFMEEIIGSMRRFDHRLWYVDGKPARGSRDIDGDGMFEVSETWHDGKLDRVSADTEGGWDGNPDRASRQGGSVEGRSADD